MEVLYSEGVSPMIDPEYRLDADPTRGGIGGTVGAVDIADRFINAYRWSGTGPNPGAHDDVPVPARGERDVRGHRSTRRST